MHDMRIIDHDVDELLVHEPGSILTRSGSAVHPSRPPMDPDGGRPNEA